LVDNKLARWRVLSLFRGDVARDAGDLRLPSDHLLRQPKRDLLRTGAKSGGEEKEGPVGAAATGMRGVTACADDVKKVAAR
jgi:hypothetical protein